jgi:hypothetical protein
MREEDLASMNGLRSMKLAVVNAFLCSPTTTPENSLDDTKQGANSLGLQVQSVVARVNFPHEETWSLYLTLGEESKKLSSFFIKQPTKQFSYLVSPTPPSSCQAQGVNVIKINMICN